VLFQYSKLCFGNAGNKNRLLRSLTRYGRLANVLLKATKPSYKLAQKLKEITTNYAALYIVLTGWRYFSC